METERDCQKGMVLSEKDLHCLARQIQSWSAPEDESLNTSQRYYACVYCKYVHDCETPVEMHQKKVLNKLRHLTGVDIFPGLRYLYWQFLPASRFLECPEELPVLKKIHKDMSPDEYQEYKNYLDELIERSKEVQSEVKEDKQVKTSKINIHTEGTNARIIVDGHEVKGVTGYSISHDAAGTPLIQLSLLGTDMTFDSDMIPALPESYNGLYVSKQKLIDSGLISEDQILALE